MLNQYRRRYLARLQTLLKEFYELDAAGDLSPKLVPPPG